MGRYTQRKRYNSENTSNDESCEAKKDSPSQHRPEGKRKLELEHDDSYASQLQPPNKRMKLEENNKLKPTLDAMSKCFQDLYEKLLLDYGAGEALHENIKTMMGHLLHVYQFVDRECMKMLCSVTRSIEFIDDIENELIISADQSQLIRHSGLKRSKNEK
ncbi:hypothetical protein ACTXT7_006577 [Hymenolepis weldensis]